MNGTCDHCGVRFHRRRSTARYCSLKCRVAAHRLRPQAADLAPGDAQKPGALSVTDAQGGTILPFSVTDALAAPQETSTAPSTGRFYLLQLQDECPSIGSGRRHVEVVSIGPAWVQLRYYTSAGVVRGKLSREAWDRKLASKRPPVPVGPPVPALPPKAAQGEPTVVSGPRKEAA